MGFTTILTSYKFQTRMRLEASNSLLATLGVLRLCGQCRLTASIDRVSWLLPWTAKRLG